MFESFDFALCALLQPSHKKPLIPSGAQSALYRGTSGTAGRTDFN